MLQRPHDNSEQASYRDMARRFVASEIAPHFDAWESAGVIDRELFRKAGDLGLLCPQVPEQYGGPGASFQYNAIVVEELNYGGFAGPASCFSVHSDVCAGYLLTCGSEGQKQAWLPRLVSGDAVCAIAMTEPGAGSDLQGVQTRARPQGDHYIINGQKTFISNGQQADLVIVVARTSDAPGHKGISLLLVEGEREGLRRGRNLDKLGHKSADTSELFLDDVVVPRENLLGGEGGGFAVLMGELPQERLTLAVSSMAAAQRAYDITVAYVHERKAFGQPIAAFQNTRFKLADLKTELLVGWAFVDQCLDRHERGELDTFDASAAKLWCSEMHGRMVDACVQLHGGYGFMREYEICRLYADARVQRIYGGTSEIMRELISRNL
ncbi:MAG: acyl-CoA dehydrogenase family protein [Salinisphaera sp.]|nr:acyl-CoA dehydrogenase family protein [Salinisphaera sp.]